LNYDKTFKNIRLFKLSTHLLFSLLIALTFLSACVFNDDTAVNADLYKSITLYHINDVHSHLDQTKDTASNNYYGGAARLKTLLNARDPNESVFLMAGDILQGTLYYNFFHGQAEIETFNAIGLDAMALGNHEFDGGVASLYTYFSKSSYPLLAANISFKTSPDLAALVKPYVIINKNGIKIAVIGVDTPEIVSDSPALSNDIDIKGPAEILREYAVELRNKADLVVALTHIGNAADLKLASEVDGVDIIIGGHSHTEVLNPVMVTNKSGVCYVVQTGAYMKYLGYLKLKVRPRELATSGEQRFIYEGGGLTYIDPAIAPDAGVDSIVQKYSSQISDNVKKVIATTASVLDGDPARNRSQETNLGDIYADAMKDFTKADIAAVNGGSFRQSIQGPDISIENVLNASPYDNLVATIDVTGAELISDLEMTAARYDGEWGGFLQFSKGFKVVFENHSFIAASLDGIAIDPARVYKLATSDYIAGGGNGHSNFANKDPDLGTMVKMNDVFIEYIQKIPQPVDYRVEGRIVINQSLSNAKHFIFGPFSEM
jgi:2',3'-cyclic-nucleotide 2'-phosphodiesterase (5'-nucleotidase family)